MRVKNCDCNCDCNCNCIAIARNRICVLRLYVNGHVVVIFMRDKSLLYCNGNSAIQSNRTVWTVIQQNKNAHSSILRFLHLIASFIHSFIQLAKLLLFTSNVASIATVLLLYCICIATVLLLYCYCTINQSVARHSPSQSQYKSKSNKIQ